MILLSFAGCAMYMRSQVGEITESAHVCIMDVIFDLCHLHEHRMSWCSHTIFRSRGFFVSS